MEFINVILRDYPAQFSALLLFFYACIDQLQKHYMNKTINDNKADSKEVQNLLFGKLDKILEKVEKVSCDIAGLSALKGKKED